MENNSPSTVSSVESCYVPSSAWVPNAEQLSQMSLTQFANSSGQGFSTAAHIPIRAQVEVKAPNCIPGDNSGISLAVPFRMNGIPKPDKVLNCTTHFYDSAAAVLKSSSSQQQAFIQASVNAQFDSQSSIEISQKRDHLALNTSLSLNPCSSPDNEHGMGDSMGATVAGVGNCVNANYTGMNSPQSSFMSKQGVKSQLETAENAASYTSDTIDKSFSCSIKVSSASCCEPMGLNAPGTELSLAIASVVDNGADSTDDSNSFVSAFNNTSQIAGSSNFDKALSRKDEMFLRLFQQVSELELQLKERKTWAQEKALQAACKFSKDMAELKSLRLEHEEILCLKRDTQALEDNTMKRLNEMDSALKKASAQVDKANASVRKLEIENAELRAEMEAAKLSAAESNAKCREVAKREKKSLKKIQAWEKQKGKMLNEISKQKQQITQAQEQLASIKMQQYEAEMRWRQEEKAKEDAISQADAEKWAREQLELLARRKEETWCQKAAADFQRHKDDIERLESELDQLKIAAEASKSKVEANSEFAVRTTETNGLQSLKETSSQLLQELAELQDSRDICRDRECVMCMSEESSVVFLPCAHQIVCINCNSLHQKQGMRDCPSCRTLIQRRIEVLSISTMH